MGIDGSYMYDVRLSRSDLLPNENSCHTMAL